MWRSAAGIGFLVSCLLVAVVGAAEREEGAVPVPDGFLSGNIWRDMRRSEQRAYSMGVVDGIIFASAFERHGVSLAWIRVCIVGMRSDQVEALLKAEVEANPGEWHHAQVHTMMYRALLKACPNSPKEGG